jgi:cyanophycin synthetase
MNPAVDAAVLETARGGVLREGLAFDRCDVAVVTNVGDGDHLGVSEVNTPEDLAKVKRCIVDVVPPNGVAVLNAADPLVVGMEPHCAGGIFYFALDGNHPTLVRHRTSGGKVIFVRQGSVVVAEGEREEVILSLDRVPLTLGGKIAFHVENTLAAVAAALSLKVPADVIRSRAESFTADMDKVPGRFNLLEIHGATVIVDYGHNAHALEALIQAIGQFPNAHRTCVYSTAGDRRDCDMLRQGQLLGDAFDRVILYDDHYTRGRADGEIIRLIRAGTTSGKRVKQVEEVRGSLVAVETALKSVRPGELMLVQADAIDETVQYIRRYVEAITPEPVLPVEPQEAAEKPPATAQVAKAMEEAEVGNGLLAQTPAIAKVEPITQCP